MTSAADVVIVGGGHNGLVAAAYLGRAGHRVTVLEARDELGGAVASATVFPGVDARLSRFSYLVSLLPEKIIAELGLDLELRSRTIRSFTPVGDHGLLVRRTAADDTDLDRSLAALAAVVEPTLTAPLPRAADLRAKIEPGLWSAVTERPIGELIEARETSDAVRGALLTDALIGTFSYAHDPSLRQNRCFLFHVIGNGTGEWRVPVGGMGAVTAALARAAAAAGADLRTSTPVTRVQPGGGGAERSGRARVELAGGEVLTADVVLANCAPATLDRLLGREPSAPAPVGSQLKINMVVRRLPRLRSGLDPEVAFAGTLHLAQGYTQLQEAYEQAAAGRIPGPLPAEIYCHSLTDPSILGPEERAAGYHTLTLFGLHTPVELFRADPDRARVRARRAALRSLQDALTDPLDEVLARDANGRPCVEVMTPVDIERELGLPGGHIFHGDLQWPWLADDAVADTPAERWGVATDVADVLLCGSGAVRGGAVSGIGGHNAAMAVLEAAA